MMSYEALKCHFRKVTNLLSACSSWDPFLSSVILELLTCLWALGVLLVCTCLAEIVCPGFETGRKWKKLEATLSFSISCVLKFL